MPCRFTRIGRRQDRLLVLEGMQSQGLCLNQSFLREYGKHRYVSKTRQLDDLTPEEIKDIDEFYENDDGKKTLSFDDFLKELSEEA